MADRVAFITGGMGGIGTAICRRLAVNGNKVIAGCMEGYDRKDEWLEQVRGDGLDIHTAEGNVDDFASCSRMIEQVAKEIGPIDILVNNAGITRDAMFKRMSALDWNSVINTNLNSVFNVTRQVIDGMTRRGWGRVINISSVNAIRGQAGQTNYAAAKAGMHGFSKALAQEVVTRGVTVNTISPGYVETEMVRSIREDILQGIIEQIPMRRLAQPSEIAALVAYLVSEEAGYVTGENISINGGLHMG